MLIGVGYLTSLFGENEEICPLYSLFFVIITSCILVCATVGITCLIAKYRYREDRVYSYKKLCEMIDSDIVTDLIPSEIDEIFNHHS